MVRTQYHAKVWRMLKESFQIRETCCTIVSDKKRGIKTAMASIKRNRKTLEEYLKNNPRFLHILEPITPPAEPPIARLMAEAAERATVGPMAAVAGVIADLAVKDMINAGCKVAVVENGGEVSAISERTVDVALAAGDTPLSKRFGFRLNEFPIGLATSSGRFSHALSFGVAEAATVFCAEAGLADAAATAVGNVVKGEDPKVAVQKGIDKAMSIEGVKGVLILYKGFTGTAGKIPELIKVIP